MTLEGSTKAPFYAFTRNDQIWKNGVHEADFQYFQVGFSAFFPTILDLLGHKMERKNTIE